MLSVTDPLEPSANVSMRANDESGDETGDESVTAAGARFPERRLPDGEAPVRLRVTNPDGTQSFVQMTLVEARSIGAQLIELAARPGIDGTDVVSVDVAIRGVTRRLVMTAAEMLRMGRGLIDTARWVEQQRGDDGGNEVDEPPESPASARTAVPDTVEYRYELARGLPMVARLSVRDAEVLGRDFALNGPRNAGEPKSGVQTSKMLMFGGAVVPVVPPTGQREREIGQALMELAARARARARLAENPRAGMTQGRTRGIHRSHARADP